jgi:hypothetical protein
MPRVSVAREGWDDRGQSFLLTTKRVMEDCKSWELIGSFSESGGFRSERDFRSQDIEEAMTNFSNS